MEGVRSRDKLLEWIDYSKAKGLMKPATAEARRAAVNQVMGILSEIEAQDVAKIDVDALLDRFHNLHGKRYTPDSLKTYRARVRNAIADFLRYLENPIDYKPSVQLAPKRQIVLHKSTKKIALPERTQVDTAKPITATIINTSTLPIPLRADLTILVHGLPFDLTEQEARKVANVILAMAAGP